MEPFVNLHWSTNSWPEYIAYGPCSYKGCGNAFVLSKVHNGIAKYKYPITFRKDIGIVGFETRFGSRRFILYALSNHDRHQECTKHIHAINKSEFNYRFDL